MSIDDEIKEKLTFDEDVEVDYTELSSFLAEYIRLGKDTGKIVKCDSFSSLNVEERILIIFLTERLRDHMDYETSGWLTPDQLSEVIDKNVGDIYPTIRNFEMNGLLENKKAKYRIPDEQVMNVIDSFE